MPGGVAHRRSAARDVARPSEIAVSRASKRRSAVLTPAAYLLGRWSKPPGAVGRPRSATGGAGHGPARPAQEPWHFLYFFPEPHQHGSFRPMFSRSLFTTGF